jgi:hypothetical protein
LRNLSENSEVSADAAIEALKGLGYISKLSPKGKELAK